MEENNLKDCCSNEVKISPAAKKGFLSGILYGLIPHVFCIAFVLFSIIGATTGALLFKNFLLIPYFFQFLIALSFVSATISAIFYLKRNGILSWQGVRRKKGYLGILYGTTLAVNLLFFFVVFPAVANIGSVSQVAATTENPNSLALLTIAVDIPCSGHAPIVIGEVKGLIGVNDVKFELPNIFKISYDKEKTSPLAILSLKIFKTFKATIK